jgi:hypothetical protein
MVERVAKALDPEIWVTDLPTPTRADTEAFHTRRQRSIVQARAAISAMQLEGDIPVYRMVDATDEFVKK